MDIKLLVTAAGGKTQLGLCQGRNPETSGRCASQRFMKRREMVVTFVSRCGLQRQSNIGELSPNEIDKSLGLHIESLNSHDKTMQTRTFMGSPEE